MSGYRRRLAAIANELIFGVDFSKQPDNEVWYKTKNDTILPSSINLIGGWKKQEGLEVVSHVYENGIGKVVYNMPVKRLGEGAFRFSKGVLFFSSPRTLTTIQAWVFKDIVSKELDNLIFLSQKNVTMSGGVYNPPVKCLYVQPGHVQYYKELGYNNIIEKKI